MIYEAHLTVLEGSEAFRSACDELGLKRLEIELAEGESPKQPMTSSFHKGTLEAVLAEVKLLAEALTARGVVVTRTKIEAHGTTFEESPFGYYEFHLKLAVDGVPPRLLEIAKAHHAHVSRSAQGSERFVTLRVHEPGQEAAEARFTALCDALATEGFNLRKKIREYTVFDSNLELDRGWL